MNVRLAHIIVVMGMNVSTLKDHSDVLQLNVQMDINSVPGQANVRGLTVPEDSGRIPEECALVIYTE